MVSDPSLRKRLLRDIAELQSEPYPYIEFHAQDSLETACLILTPEGTVPLHLGMSLHNYPLRAPTVTIQTRIRHPNIFGDYICASILNTREGYTPAYTLKSIAIQLLSFFSSDSLEQEHGGVVDLTRYKARNSVPDRDYWSSGNRSLQGYHCSSCGFDSRPRIPQARPKRPPIQSPGRASTEQQSRVIRGHRFVLADERRRMNDGGTGPSIASGTDSLVDTGSSEAPIRALPTISITTPASDAGVTPPAVSLSGTLTEPLEVSISDHMSTIDRPVESFDIAVCIAPTNQSKTSLMDLPHEILLLIMSSLSFLDLTAMSRAFPMAREIIDFYDLIRVRELRCFCLKEHFQDSKLGVGVHVGRQGKEKNLSSEFDLLSARAFEQHAIRRSIHGLEFEYWLPLPLSRRHFRAVKDEALQSLNTLAFAGRFTDSSHFSILSHFLNDIVVSFSEEAERSNPSSTLSHASEKAVESYFAIYHLLLCLAASDPYMIRKANNKIFSFLSGKTSKTSCPNLGHLLVATLISDHHLSESLSVALIKEAVLRNVVWMLDAKGANMPELSYLEPSATSDYRLKKTFEASLTSYRLLMFCHLFSRTARGLTSNTKTLAQLRDDLFDTHGAPPRGVAASMAQEIRRIKAIDNFPPFLKEMGISDQNIPGKAEFTAFLRKMVVRSVEVGYSKWPISQTGALGLRILKEPGVEIGKGVRVGEKWQVERAMGRISFFPGRDAGRGERRVRNRWVG
ncbi:MAG: hypothetical protein Q9215_002795 [Flavoplaca cf. flavocitrina]